MMDDIVSKVVLKNTVTTRRVPMTEEGMTNLRVIREFYKQRIKDKLKQDVEIPFPSVFDMLLRDFVREHKLDVSNTGSVPNTAD